jgi:methyl-accepting chemotaxis protein
MSSQQLFCSYRVDVFLAFAGGKSAVTQRNVRQPFRHFFIKKGMQFKIIAEILFVAMLTAILTTGTLTIMYNSKAKNGTFYYMSNDSKEDLQLRGILELILPSVLGAQVFSILIGLGIGLFSSRKMAVPIYKFEKWVSQLKNGNLNTKLSFRENEEMKDLTLQCNALASYYRGVFTELDKAVSVLEKSSAKDPASMEQLKQMKAILQKVNFS